MPEHLTSAVIIQAIMGISLGAASMGMLLRIFLILFRQPMTTANSAKIGRMTREAIAMFIAMIAITLLGAFIDGWNAAITIVITLAAALTTVRSSTRHPAAWIFWTTGAVMMVSALTDENMVEARAVAALATAVVITHAALSATGRVKRRGPMARMGPGGNAATLGASAAAACVLTALEFTMELTALPAAQ